MREITIHSPIWKSRSIGIAAEKITDDLSITIDYKKKDGEMLYPEKYFISRERAIKYPTQTIRNSIVLHIIPINELDLTTI